MVANNPLRPYFFGGAAAFGGAPLDSHDNLYAPLTHPKPLQKTTCLRFWWGILNGTSEQLLEALVSCRWVERFGDKEHHERETPTPWSKYMANRPQKVG